MSPTRRSLLQMVVSAGMAGVAGCSTSSESPSPQRSPPDRETRSGSITEPAVSKPRNPAENVVLLTRNGTETERSGSHTSSTEHRVIQTLFVDDEDVSEVTFADGVSQRDVDEAKSFLQETDFDDQSVFFRTVRTESCQRYRIQSVSWEPGHVEYEFCRELRPPTHTCAADRWEAVGLFIRIPAALNTDLSGTGASGHSPCDATDTDYRQIDANVTVEGPRTITGANDSSRIRTTPVETGEDA